jgi:hypothetical protein
MRINSSLSLFFLFLVLFFSSCALTAMGGESDSEVREKCLSSLGKKYGKEFRIVSNKRYFHGGHGRYLLEITAAPVDSKGIKFKVRYNYREGQVTGDQYKKAFWEEQVSRDARLVLKRFSQVKGVRARLRANNSLAFNTSELRFHRDYRELVKNIRHPRLKLEIKLINAPRDPAVIRGLVKLAGHFSREKFEKVEFSVFFDQGKGGRAQQLLKFRIKRGLRVPRERELADMISRKGKDEYFQVNRKLYTDAEKNERAGDTPVALLLYRKIIGRDRPYRFREYIISESAYVVQAAFRMGKIYEKRGDRKNALRYYTFLLKKMEYSEVPLKLARSAKEARKRIDILK